MRIALPITGQETSFGRAKLPLSRRTSLAYTNAKILRVQGSTRLTISLTVHQQSAA